MKPRNLLAAGWICPLLFIPALGCSPSRPEDGTAGRPAARGPHHPPVTGLTGPAGATDWRLAAHHAALKGDAARLVELLELRSADATASAGWMLLDVLIVSPHNLRRELAEMLLAHGASANAADFKGNTALYFAASQARPDLVQMLLARGADPNLARAGFGPLHNLALSSRGTSRERAETARILIEAGADVNAREESMASSPLHVAAYCDRDADAGVARVLVQRCADVLARDKDGKTPADLARQRGNYAVLELLIGNGKSEGREE